MSALVLLAPTIKQAITTDVAFAFQPDAGVEDSNVQSPPQSWRVRFWSDVDCWIHVDNTEVAATASDFPVTAKDSRQNTFVIPPGGFISVLAQSASGNAYFTRVKHS